MSHYLDAAACSDAQRREDLAKNDAAMAHGITRVSLAKVGGQHLSDAANEPSEAEWIAADLARNLNKGPLLAARDARMALEEQVQHMREVGAL